MAKIPELMIQVFREGAVQQPFLRGILCHNNQAWADLLITMPPRQGKSNIITQAAIRPNSAA